MKGTIIDIYEGAFGGEILSIEILGPNDEMEIVESRGFLNGLGGNPILIEGDKIEFDLKFNKLSKCYFAKNIKESK